VLSIEQDRIQSPSSFFQLQPRMDRVPVRSGPTLWPRAPPGLEPMKSSEREEPDEDIVCIFTSPYVPLFSFAQPWCDRQNTETHNRSKECSCALIREVSWACVKFDPSLWIENLSLVLEKVTHFGVSYRLVKEKIALITAGSIRYDVRPSSPF
jgi:hypothetical protein